MTVPVVRKHGEAPFRVAVVHGGPGVAGDLAPVARELSQRRGVLEPLQNGDSVEAQIEELIEQLQAHGTSPLVLVGYSWGAWLCCYVAARVPTLVDRLILVAAPPFDDVYANEVLATRLGRLDGPQVEQWFDLAAIMGGEVDGDRDRSFRELGRLAEIVDIFDLDPAFSNDDPVELSWDLFDKVWSDACLKRSTGKLMAAVSKVTCPVLAIHGDYDAQPVAGVREPLTGVLSDFRLVVLEKCGHSPWKERHARAPLLLELEREISRDG